MVTNGPISIHIELIYVVTLLYMVPELGDILQDIMFLVVVKVIRNVEDYLAKCFLTKFEVHSQIDPAVNIDSELKFSQLNNINSKNN